MNLAALTKAVNVSHEFLASYVFEHGLGQPVSEIQAAAALESDQFRGKKRSLIFRNSLPWCKKRYSSL